MKKRTYPLLSVTLCFMLVFTSLLPLGAFAEDGSDTASETESSVPADSQEEITLSGADDPASEEEYQQVIESAEEAANEAYQESASALSSTSEDLTEAASGEDESAEENAAASEESTSQEEQEAAETQETAQTAEVTKADLSWYTANPSASTFTIENEAQLLGMAYILNAVQTDSTGASESRLYGESFRGKTIRLGNDLDMSTIVSITTGQQMAAEGNEGTPTMGSSWIPAGSGGVEFAGTFDGCGYTISGLKLGTENRPVSYDYCGLFGKLTGTVENLTISGSVSAVKQAGVICAGGIAGAVCSGASVINCRSDVKLQISCGGTVYAGGIAGRCEEGAVLDACLAAGSVSAGSSSGSAFKDDIAVSDSMDGSSQGTAFWTGCVSGDLSGSDAAKARLSLNRIILIRNGGKAAGGLYRYWTEGLMPAAASVSVKEITLASAPCQHQEGEEDLQYDAGSQMENLEAAVRAANPSLDNDLLFSAAETETAGENTKALTMEILDGDTLILPHLKCTGLVHTGWQQDDAGDLQQPGASLTIESDLALTACWRAAEKCTLTLDGNGAQAKDSDESAQAVLYEDEDYTIPKITDYFNNYLEKENDYRFMGWELVPENENIWTAAFGEDSLYQPGDTLENVPGNAVLKAVWEKQYRFIYKTGAKASDTSYFTGGSDSAQGWTIQGQELQLMDRSEVSYYNENTAFSGMSEEEAAAAKAAYDNCYLAYWEISYQEPDSSIISVLADVGSSIIEGIKDLISGEDSDSLNAYTVKGETEDSQDLTVPVKDSWNQADWTEEAGGTVTIKALPGETISMPAAEGDITITGVWGQKNQMVMDNSSESFSQWLTEKGENPAQIPVSGISENAPAETAEAQESTEEGGAGEAALSGNFLDLTASASFSAPAGDTVIMPDSINGISQLTIDGTTYRLAGFRLAADYDNEKNPYTLSGQDKAGEETASDETVSASSEDEAAAEEGNTEESAESGSEDVSGGSAESGSEESSASADVPDLAFTFSGNVYTGEDFLSGLVLAGTSVTMPDQDQTWCAVWARSCLITFTAPEGTALAEGNEGFVSQLSLYEGTTDCNGSGQPYVLPENPYQLPTAADDQSYYRFVGWQDFTGTIYNAGSSFYPMGDTELRAVFKNVKKWDGSVALSFEGDHAGTKDDPYVISEADQLAKLTQDVNGLNGTSIEDYSGKYFTITETLDLNGQEWVPIGSEEHPFRGHINSSEASASGSSPSFTVCNFTINSLYKEALTGDTGYAGVFGCIGREGSLSGMTVSDAIINLSASGSSEASDDASDDEEAAESGSGTVSAQSLGGTVTALSDEEAASDEESAEGEEEDNSFGSVSKPITAGGKAEELPAGIMAGLIAGLNEGTITGCCSDGTVTIRGGNTTSMVRAGGLVGTNSGTLTTTTSDATVTVSGSSLSDASAGGGVGIMTEGTMQDCAARGAVSLAGSGNAGGLLGQAGSAEGSQVPVISYCYSMGTVTGESAGNLIGNIAGPVKIACVYAMNDDSRQITGSSGVYTDEIQFVGGDNDQSLTPEDTTYTSYDPADLFGNGQEGLDLVQTAENVVEATDDKEALVSGTGLQIMTMGQFNTGETAYELDGGSREIRNTWTQTSGDYPILGTGHILKISVSDYSKHTEDGDVRLRLPGSDQQYWTVYAAPGTLISVDMVASADGLQWIEGTEYEETEPTDTGIWYYEYQDYQGYIVYGINVMYSDSNGQWVLTDVPYDVEFGPYDEYFTVSANGYAFATVSGSFWVSSGTGLRSKYFVPIEEIIPEPEVEETPAEEETVATASSGSGNGSGRHSGSRTVITDDNVPASDSSSVVDLSGPRETTVADVNGDMQLQDAAVPTAAMPEMSAETPVDNAQTEITEPAPVEVYSQEPEASGQPEDAVQENTVLPETVEKIFEVIQDKAAENPLLYILCGLLLAGLIGAGTISRLRRR